MTSLAPQDGTRTDARDGSILCTDLVRIYRTEDVEVQALQGLNLRVDTGEVVAIIGASGSGKSTLLGILSGNDLPTAGTAIVGGTSVSTLRGPSATDYRRHTVGFVWQQADQNLLPYLTVRENLEMAQLVASTRGSGQRVTELLDLLEISPRADRLPRELSGGERQRAAIAVGLVNSPRVLLADEPTGELDEATSQDVLEIMNSVNAELGTTVLIVTHDDTVSQHVPRTIQIRDGRTSTEVLRGDGHADAASGEYTVIDAAGRLQLPAGYLERLQLRDRVRLELELDRVSVFPGQQNQPAATEGDLHE